MKKIVSILFFLFAFSGHAAFALTTTGNSQLRITLDDTTQGVELSSINNNGTELLNEKSNIFSLDIKDLTSNNNSILSSANSWGNIHVTSNNTLCTIIFSNPVNNSLPATLRVTLTIKVTNTQSQWDLAVSGLGPNHSLTTVTFPELKIGANGNDHFLIPKYSGKAIPNPLATRINQTLVYPRGWGGTLPFLSYYNKQRGLYLGYHDPKASLKTFEIKAENNHINFNAKIPIPNKTKPNNNWNLPGVFELDVYRGDWYDAAMIYKKWAEKSAEYWPKMTPARIKRQSKIGRIGVWGTFMQQADESMPALERLLEEFNDYFSGIPTGLHWYQWNYQTFDNDYPNYFPERTGMAGVVSRIQQSGNSYIMPYINGRLYDTDLQGGAYDYPTHGKPYATKKDNGEIYLQDFQNNHFAVMCPTQKPWQNFLIDVSRQLTNRIGTHGLYIDQACASMPTECMDPDHNHPLGGGHWWRDGYKEMFNRIHAALPSESFVATEGGVDYLVDEVDGFLTGGWTSNHLVPAFQAVYSGKVQFSGKDTGSGDYNKKSFYCKLAQALVHGIQPARFQLWMVHDENAAATARPFVRNIATMRYKLRDFLAFGSLQRPLNINGNNPMITSVWHDYGAPVNVTISAIQSGVYKSRDNNSVAVLFVNASMTNTLNFSFNFNGNQYNLSGKLSIGEITEITNSTMKPINNTFTKHVSLPPMKSVAYIVTSGKPGFPLLLSIPSLIKQEKDRNE